MRRVTIDCSQPVEQCVYEPWRDYDCRDRQVTVSAETLNDRSYGSYVALADQVSCGGSGGGGGRSAGLPPVSTECNCGSIWEDMWTMAGVVVASEAVSVLPHGRLARVAITDLTSVAPLVGQGGSGTIFFSYCNLACVFCQNWEISHGGEGEERPRWRP